MTTHDKLIFLNIQRNKRRNKDFKPFPFVFYNKDGNLKWADNPAKAKVMGIRWDTDKRKWVCRGKWKPNPPWYVRIIEEYYLNLE